MKAIYEMNRVTIALTVLALLVTGVSFAEGAGANDYPCVPQLVQHVSQTHGVLPRVRRVTLTDNAPLSEGEPGTVRWMLVMTDRASKRLIAKAECRMDSSGKVLGFRTLAE